MTGPVLRLHSSDLLSRWGFNDGDTPDAVYDYCEEHGISYSDVDWDSTLAKLVRLYLLPALDQTVDIYEIETHHNPIRARAVDGATDIDSAVLTPEYVDVPMARVLAAMGLD